MNTKAEHIVTEKNKVIEIKNLSKSFGKKQVLQNFSLDLYEGENLVVLGKSGSGKSVLIKCIIGLIAPDSGSIRVLNKKVANLNKHELDQLRAQIGFLFQSNALYDSMTVRENLEFPLRRHWIETTKKEAENLVMEVLTSVGLPETVDMLPADLSGGMKKRVALARTLILKPKIILYDEPTTGLDPITGREISELMLDIQKRYNTSSIVISHDMSCVKIVADRIAMLIDGKCHLQGTYKELEQSKDEKVKHFFE